MENSAHLGNNKKQVIFSHEQVDCGQQGLENNTSFTSPPLLSTFCIKEEGKTHVTCPVHPCTAVLLMGQGIWPCLRIRSARCVYGREQCVLGPSAIWDTSALLCSLGPKTLCV